MKSVGSGGLRPDGRGYRAVAAREGCDVVVVESDAARASAGRPVWSAHSSELRPGAGSSMRGEVLARLRVVTDLAELADREFVVEAVVEDEAAKTTLVKELDRIVVDPEAIMASNTSRSRSCSWRWRPVVRVKSWGPLLQPGAGTSARRARPEPDDEPGRRRPCAVLRGRPARQGADPLSGPRRLRRQRVAHRVQPVGDSDARVRICDGRGHRSWPLVLGAAHP
jgi:hypothetical protein